MNEKVVFQYLNIEQIEYFVSRSQGAGGQHVNKTNSSVQLRFSISNSFFSDEHKNRLKIKLKNKIVQDDIVLIRVESERDQRTNKQIALKKLVSLISSALIEPKKRIKTKPTRSSVKKRITAKKIRSEVKQNRSKNFTD